MAVQVNPITQSLPATTAIQDPATRRFAQAVEGALRALRSEEGAVESLKKAADAMNGAIAGGTPPSIAQWLFSSELYQKLTTEIARVDTQAKQDVLDEALARSQAIQEIRAALAEIESTTAYDPATPYQIGALVTYENKLYRAKAATTGNLPTNTTYWDKVGDYATLGDVVAAHTLQLSEIESDITDIGGDLAAEITARDTLATQLRGTYAGTDVAMVSQGLLYSERQARVTADGVTVSNLNALRAQVGVTEAGTLTEGFILNEQTIRNTNDLAIVSAVNTALAQITGVSTSISQSGENLIANWSQAQATKWSQIESEVLTSGGQTIRAALLQESQTRANLEGDVYASYTLRVDANGNIAGFGLAADENSSEFIIRADKFALVTNVGGTPYVPFAIGPSGAEFTGLTSWGNVTGSGRPENGATVGADSSNLRAGRGVNLLFNAGLSLSAEGFYYNGGTSMGINHPGWCIKDGGAKYGTHFIQGTTAVEGAFYVGGGARIPVIAGKRYEAYAYTGALRCTVTFYIDFYNSAGTNIGLGTSRTFINSGMNDEHASGGTSLVGYRQIGEFCTAPAGAVSARLIVWKGITKAGFSDSWLFTTMPYFGEAGAAQTEPSPWVEGASGINTQITPSNVSTYIANAAIGNAQIGGNLWSTNWNYAGGTGWLLDRNGNFYGNNIYARGDIEASSLKTGVAMIDSLHLKGSAVIIPLQVSYSAKGINLPYAQGVWHSADVFQYTWSLSGGGLFKFSFSGEFYIAHWAGHANYGYGSLTKVVRIYINGALVETVLDNRPSGASTSLTGIIPDRFYWLGAGNQTFLIRMEALMADGGARVACAAGTVSIQSFQTGSSSV